MATLKKSARKKTASASSNENLQAQAEQLSKRLGESAQQVWLAGVGAFGRAQAEGTKLFETLVKEGLSLEQITRKTAGGKAQAMRDAVESTVGQARERASDTWDRLEKVFEERVHRALRRLEVPSREDLSALIGILVAPAMTLYYDSGFLIGLKAFVAAIIGGLVSYPLTAIGAICVGIVESFGSFWSGALKDVIVFSLLIPVLLLRSALQRHPEEEQEEVEA